MRRKKQSNDLAFRFFFLVFGFSASLALGFKDNDQLQPIKTDSCSKPTEYVRKY